jgi:hypothetical protein
MGSVTRFEIAALLALMIGCSSGVDGGAYEAAPKPSTTTPRPASTESASAEPPPPKPPSTVEPTPPKPEPEPELECSPVTERRVRRLSVVEYESMLSSLVGSELALTGLFSADPRDGGYDNAAGVLSVSSGNFDSFVQAAEAAALALELPDCSGRSCAKNFAAGFARRAFGRDVTAGESERLLDVYTEGASENHQTGMRLVAEAVLLSPHTLYRTEIGTSSASSSYVELESADAANSLAFALTGMRPDDELLDRAADPGFLAADALRAEAERLIATAEGNANLERFLRSWLGLYDLRTVNKAPDDFPEFTDTLKGALEAEVTGFLQGVLNGEGTLNAILGSDHTFVTRRSYEAIYRPDFAATEPPSVPEGNLLVRMDFNPVVRRGVLSLGSWLSAHSPVHRSSPVDRGLAIRTAFFCKSLPPPPPGALATTPNAGNATTTTRQNFEAHTSDSSCASCHRLIDPIGFGLENMDAIGRYRETEKELPVDSSGRLVDTDVDADFAGPAELAELLLKSREVRDCFVTQLFRYTEGRSEQEGDECVLEPVRNRFAEGDMTIAELAVEIATRPGALMRRLEK